MRACDGPWMCGKVEGLVGPGPMAAQLFLRDVAAEDLRSKSTETRANLVRLRKIAEGDSFGSA